MESWCFDSMDKGFVSTEVISTFDSINRHRGEFMGGGYKPSLSFENSGSFLSQQFVENHCFPDMGIVEMIDDYASFGDVISPDVIASNGVSGDEESSSKVSSNVIDSNSQESSLIDLKLDGFGDELGSHSTRTAHVLFAVECSTPQKRARGTSLSSQMVYCQVYGCLKDLSSEKTYHKRHKVCDVHSKTSKVIVNGVEQRFCQQCSRFHLLGEFDDRKRSCRKRLAGHNERRRKPQVGFSSRSGTSFQSYTGSNFQGLNPRSTSAGCQDMLRRGTSHMDKYEANDWVRQIKIEDGAGCTQTPAYNSIHGQLHPNSTSPSHIFEQHFPFIDNKNNSNLKSVIEENVNPSMLEIVSHSLFQTKSPGSEDLTLLNEESTIEGLPGISESSRALSLLSSKSQYTLSHSFRLPVDPPLFTSPSNNSPQYSGNEASGERYGDQNRYPLFKINPTRENQPSSMLARNFGASGNVARQSSNFMNLKDRLLLEDRNSIDLLQLSSQLHPLENQRHS